jgi:hypothetical protein
LTTYTKPRFVAELVRPSAVTYTVSVPWSTAAPYGGKPTETLGGVRPQPDLTVPLRVAPSIADTLPPPLGLELGT